MNTTMLNRTVLAVVIGSALGFGLGAPSSAQARDSAVQGQQTSGDETDEHERGRKKRERQEARDQQAAADARAAEANAAAQANRTAEENRGREQAQARQQMNEQRQAEGERDREAQRAARQEQFRQQQAQRESQQQAQREQQELNVEQARAQRERGLEQAREQQARQAREQQERSRERQDRYTPQPQPEPQPEPQPQVRDDRRPPVDGTPAYRAPADRTRNDREDRGDDTARNRDDSRRGQWGNEAETRRRIEEQRNQAERYARAQQASQERARRDAENLRNQRRTSQYRYQQDYYSRLRQYNQRYDWQRYDYNNDPYFYTAPSYRYQRDGRYYNINRYAADMLQQAINYGYAEGIRAGRADRYDGWRYSYRDSFAYIDASYGYRGMYVSQFDYRYYFRQGFQRGYEDGYYGRRRYGRQSNGSDALLGTVFSLILNLQPYRY